MNMHDLIFILVFMKGQKYAPMRRLIDAGCKLAIATDFNPGSSVHQSLPQMMQLCMANGGLTLNEALLGVTHNAALSLGLAGQVGTLQVGVVQMPMGMSHVINKHIMI